MSATEFLIIRHGETPWNVDRRIQGWRDIELNLNGQQQAHSLGQHLSKPDTPHSPIHALYSSDLLRAKQTAQALATALGLSLTTVNGVRERNYGVLEGLEFDRMHDHYPEVAKVWASRELDGVIPEGETLRQFQTRVVSTIENLARSHPSQRIIVVTHGGAMDIIWRQATATDIQASRKAPLLNASVNRIQLSPVRQGFDWSLLEWGNTDHLQSTGNDVMP